MNHVTESERATVRMVALKMVHLEDGYGRIMNYQDTLPQLMQQCGISKERARGALAWAARRQRYLYLQSQK